MDRFISHTLSTGGCCIALSTPNGVGNWFHETYILKAESGENDFNLTVLTMGFPSRSRAGVV